MRVGAQMWEEVCDILKKMVPQNGNKTATIFRSRKRDRLGICSKQNQCSIYRFLVSESVLENGTTISYVGEQRDATCWRAAPAVRDCLLPIGRPIWHDPSRFRMPRRVVPRACTVYEDFTTYLDGEGGRPCADAFADGILQTSCRCIFAKQISAQLPFDLECSKCEPTVTSITCAFL